MDIIIWSAIMLTLLSLFLKGEADVRMRAWFRLTFLINLIPVCVQVYVNGCHLYYECGSNYIHW
jgi:hypothetical protein